MHLPQKDNSKLTSRLKNGFTLIEVMAVVMIIAIIAALAMVSYTSIRVKTRDIRRVSDINTLHTALNAYYKDHGEYPTSLTPGQIFRNSDSTKIYLDEIPFNPQPRTDHNCPDSEFLYKVSTDKQTYSLSACVGAEGDPNKGKLIYSTKEGIFHCGDTITDRDGFTYKTVSIGSQCWMADSLKTRTRPDGSCINFSMSTYITPTTHIYTVGDAPGCSITYNGTLTNLGGFARNSLTLSSRDCISPSSATQGTEADCQNGYTLYTWHGAMNDPSLTLGMSTGTIAEYPRQGICPDGWHIPTSDDFTSLERSVCTSTTCQTDFPFNLTTTGTLGTNESTKLIIGGNSNFNAARIGMRSSDATPATPPTYQKNALSHFWSASFDGISNLAGRRYVSTSGGVNRNYTFRNRGYEVRCIKD